MPSRKSITSAARVAALLLLAGCHESDDFSPTAPQLDTILSLTAEDDRTTIPADGISRVRILARIAPNAAADRRTLVFSTSAGTLVGGRANADGTQEVDADLTGLATLELQSALQVGQALVQAKVKAAPQVVRQLAITFAAANPDTVIRFVAAPASAPADGATRSGLSVQISSSLPLGTQVAFSTSLGTFGRSGTNSDTVTVDGSFTATTDLVSHTAIGSARVTATAANVSTQEEIHFTRAFPDRITTALSAPTVGAAAAGTVTITATFLRDVGKVTPGTVAIFTATDAAGAPIGSFSDVTVVGQATPDVATADFLPGATAYRGPVTLTVRADGAATTATTTVTVTDP